MLVINKKAFCLYLTFKMFACLNEMFYGYTGDLDIIYMDIKKKVIWTTEVANCKVRFHHKL